jgi:hypothetical protein
MYRLKERIEKVKERKEGIRRKKWIKVKEWMLQLGTKFQCRMTQA